MENSVAQQIDAIIRKVKDRDNGGAAQTESLHLAANHPEAILEFATSVIRRHPEGGTFLHSTLGFLPEDQWPDLILFALNILNFTDGSNAAAESVIDYASLQFPKSLHRYLDRLFELKLLKRTYYRSYPWRESGHLHGEYLQMILEDNYRCDDERMFAFSALLETRDPVTLLRTVSYAKNNITPPHGWQSNEWIRAHLAYVGYCSDAHSLFRLCADSLYHLQFPKDFFNSNDRPPWLARIHPTWRLESSVQAGRIGGMGRNACNLCGMMLHRLITLEQIPQGLPITNLSRIELDTCLSCLGWERPCLFYKHDSDGIPSNIDYKGAIIIPQFQYGPLVESEIRLSVTPNRWFWQDWALSNSRENLNRIGGEPSWIQDPDYPTCPACMRTMNYLLQLDSDLPTASGDEWLWGSGGIGYAFWCDQCKMSGLLWQCT